MLASFLMECTLLPLYQERVTSVTSVEFITEHDNTHFQDLSDDEEQLVEPVIVSVGRRSRDAGRQMMELDQIHFK